MNKEELRIKTIVILEKRRSILEEFIMTARDEIAVEYAEKELGKVNMQLCAVQNEEHDKDYAAIAKDLYNSKTRETIKQMLKVEEYSGRHLETIISFLKDLDEVFPEKIRFNPLELSILLYNVQDSLFE